MERASAYEMFGVPVPPPEDSTEIELVEANDTSENGLYTLEESTVSEEAARTAFINYARRNRFYGTSTARQCTIDSIRCVDAFHYLLETFTESRSTRLIEKPHQGDAEVAGDGSTTDTVPEPWEIEIEPPKLFEDDSAHVTVPNSEQIKSCPSCLGACKVPCTFCDGAGSTMCLACTVENPSPKQPQAENDEAEGDVPVKTEESCQECNGKGRKGCSPCSESGERACAKCEENGKLKTHMELIVQWKNNWDDFIVDYVSVVPEKVLRQLQGKVVVKEERRKVSPVSNFPNVDINTASKELIESHQSEYSSHSKIIKQRHHVRVIPVSDVKYTWKNKQYNFYVYGENHESVYAPNYPQRYLCCSVM